MKADVPSDKARQRVKLHFKDKADLAYWRTQRGIREQAYNRAKSDYIGAGGNTYEEASRRKDAAQRALAKADAKVRELELAAREGQ